MQYWIVTFCRSAPSAIAPSQRLAAPSSLRSGAHDSYCFVRKSCSYVTMPSPAYTCAHSGNDDGPWPRKGPSSRDGTRRAERPQVARSGCLRARENVREERGVVAHSHVRSVVDVPAAAAVGVSRCEGCTPCTVY